MHACRHRTPMSIAILMFVYKKTPNNAVMSQGSIVLVVQVYDYLFSVMLVDDPKNEHIECCDRT